MKELTIEEKAKRYDEAIEIINDYYQKTRYSSLSCASNDIEVLEKAFPELKESEDEQHCKWILEYLYDGLRKSDEQFKDHFKAAIAWLEKQGEHANFRNKIQIGDKVTRNKDGVLVNLSQLKRVAKKDEKQGEQKPAAWSEEDEDILNTIINHFKVDIECTDEDDMVRWLKSLKERVQPQPKQEWSEEDKNMLQSILDEYKSMSIEKRNWLKSLKGRVQPKQEWSEEDESHIRYLIECLEYCKKGVALTMTTSTAQEYIDWLKSLRPQNNITDEELAQAKKDAYNDALDKIEYHSGEPTFDDGWSAAIWFLKKRNTAPQNT